MSKHLWTKEEAREAGRLSAQVRASKKFREERQSLYNKVIDFESKIKRCPTMGTGSTWTASPNFKLMESDGKVLSWICLIVESVLAGIAVGYLLMKFL